MLRKCEFNEMSHAITFSLNQQRKVGHEAAEAQQLRFRCRGWKVGSLDPGADGDEDSELFSSVLVQLHVSLAVTKS